MAAMVGFLSSCWEVFGQMAPYLLLGFFVSGILSELISPELVEKHLGGEGFLPVIKSSMLGVPLPLCSCGVIPVAASIRRHGASRGATTSFLLSTPQTGVDSILATYGLLGPVFAVIRPFAALLTGILGGLLVGIFDPEHVNQNQSDKHEDKIPEQGMKRAGWLKRAIYYGFVTLPSDIIVPLLVGVLVSSVMSTFLSPDFISRYVGRGFYSMLVMMAVGIPIYVCSTASIPLAMTFMRLGASPGAALVFLISGPATNAAAISVVWRILGWKTTFIYLLAVGLASLGSGIALDNLYEYLSSSGYRMDHHICAHVNGLMEHISGFVLIGVFITAYILSRSSVKTGISGKVKNTDTGMTVLAVSGMTCSNCVAAVSREIEKCPGVTGVVVEINTQTARISGENLDLKAVIESIEKIGYQAFVKEQPVNKNLEFIIRGMTCSHCVRSVIKTLKEVTGVTDVSVDLATGKTVITGLDLDTDEIHSRIKDLNYTVILPDEVSGL